MKRCKLCGIPRRGWVALTIRMIIRKTYVDILLAITIPAFAFCIGWWFKAIHWHNHIEGFKQTWGTMLGL